MDGKMWVVDHNLDHSKWQGMEQHSAIDWGREEGDTFNTDKHLNNAHRRTPE